MPVNAGPLAGKRVLVTRPRHQAGDLAGRIRDLGGIPVEVPAISVQPLADSATLDEALARPGSYDWFVFTSANGVAAAADRLADLGLPIELPRTCRIAAIGPATARALAARFREPDVVPETFISDAIADAMGDVSGLRVLLLRADIARRELPIELVRRGADVAEVAAYRIEVGGADGAARLDTARAGGPPDIITLTSPSAARGLLQLLSDAGLQDWMATAELVCIGPITAREVEKLGYVVGRVARRYTCEGLVDVLRGEGNTG